MGWNGTLLKYSNESLTRIISNVFAFSAIVHFFCPSIRCCSGVTMVGGVYAATVHVDGCIVLWITVHIHFLMNYREFKNIFLSLVHMTVAFKNEITFIINEVSPSDGT